MLPSWTYGALLLRNKDLKEGFVMKFDFGHWSLLPNTEALYPLSITHVQADADSLTVHGW